MAPIKAGRGLRHAKLALTLLSMLMLGVLPRTAQAAEPVTVTDYTDSSEALPWGGRSHWMQPWRSYLDTVPGSTLRSAVGINFNVAPKIAAPTARMLAESGFHRARIEVGWNNIDFDDPSRLSETGQKNLEKTLEAFRDNDIRPLILLNANDGQPCPVRSLTLHLTQPADIGATVIHIAPADVPSVAPGRTGLPFRNKAAFQLIASIDAQGTAQLAAPLRTAYPAGEVKADTLLYQPFSPPLLPDGEPNPRFQATMAGWLNYVGVVTREVKRLMGSEAFDVEIWNELSFGSAFLNVNNYYSPDIEAPSKGATPAMLTKTIAYLRNPEHGVPNIGIGNGFANQRPWDNGSESPLGLSAIDKHPYTGWEQYPEDAQVNGNRPFDGLGQPAGWLDSANQFHESFTPTYDAYFPERFLSGIYTETLVHDLSPFPSPIARVLHGRYTHPEGGSPPRMWITEVNMSPTGGPTPASSMSAADIRHVETKTVLRYITAFVNKGVEAIDIFAASAGTMSVVDKPFFQAVNANPTAYPGAALGGETVAAVRRLTDAMKGSEITKPRSLELRSLTDFESNVQFAGDPDDPVHYPPLYNRDVFAFFPFQTSDTRFVIPVYVMTRNVVEDYRPGTSQDPTRFDLPEEPYRLEIGGIHGVGATVNALDPTTGESIPVDVVAEGDDEITVDVQVTDSPRLLIIDEPGEESGGPEAGDRLPAGVGEAPAEEAEPEPPAGEEGTGEGEDGIDEGEGGEGEEGGPGDEGEGGSGGQSDDDKPDEGSDQVGPGSRPPTVRRTTEPGSDPEGTVRMKVQRPRALLGRRQLRVSAHCEPACRLLIAGKLTIGKGHPYRMFQVPRQVGAGTTNPKLVLGITPLIAKLARRALREGAPLKVVVVGRAEFGPTDSRHVAQTTTLRR